jgi:Sec-independent protein translocase protein TatA
MGNISTAELIIIVVIGFVIIGFLVRMIKKVFKK